MWKSSVMGMVVLALLLAGAALAGRDVTKPGDVIQGIPNDGVSQNDDHGWPGNEPPPQAIDDQIVTKYLHFKGEDEPTGFRVTPAIGPTVVTALTFTTANDAEPRDPIEYELSGSNVSIEGPWTPIASGPIVDFAGATAWPRRTKTTTPITFNNDVAYAHYQVMFPIVRDPGNANSMQIAEVELLMDIFHATEPIPADGAIGVAQPLMQWTAGDGAIFHDVYFGTSPDLTAADLKGNHVPFTMYFHIPGLEPGVTYYWRVDEVTMDGTITQGEVWSFTSAPYAAYSPEPRDGDKWISVDTQLSWLPGQNATGHEVYFGTDRAAVEARDASVYKGSTIAPTYDPGPLQQETTYYWAVDETGTTPQAGDVWSFTTTGGGGGIKGEYFNNTTLAGAPVLVRIDPEVNFNLVGVGPGAPVPVDGWSARWTADLEIAVADTFVFSVNCQDGTRLWIDGELIIDQWITPTVTSKYFSLPIHLERGIHSLRLEYFDSGGDAVEELAWSTPTMSERIIPAGPLQPPVRAREPYPADGAGNIAQDVILSWIAGDGAAQHQVYFGDDEDAVANATTADAAIYRGQQALEETTYDPGLLEWGKAYYWRVDEVNVANAVSVWTGGVWSFTAADFIVIDDMESYDDDIDGGTAIFQTWIDGVDNGTGSYVGYEVADKGTFGETVIVHSGRQSLPLDYNNAVLPNYSETDRTFAPAQDWTVNGVDTLVLHVRGGSGNDGSQPLYVAIEDSAGNIGVVSSTDPAILTTAAWTEWRIALSEFGVNAAAVQKIYIGVGNRNAPVPGGAGLIYIDDVWVVQAAGE